jgi:hypothetical protein
VIFNQQGWEKQEIGKGADDRDEGRKYESHPPFHLYPVRNLSLNGTNTEFNTACEPSG